MNPTDGIFDFEQLNTIRDAHKDWCAEHSIDPSSPLGQESAGIMLNAARTGICSREELIASCDTYVKQRESHVRLGTPAIDSHS